MSGLSHWRSNKPQHFTKIVEKLHSSHSLSLLTQSDPTKFVVKNGEKKFRVSIGNPHTCECKREQPCLHVVFVLSTYFHVALDNVSIFQSGLSEIVIMDLVEQQREKRKSIESCPLCNEGGANLSKCSNCPQRFHWKCVELASVMRERDPGCPRCGVAVEQQKEVHPIIRCDHCNKENTENIQYRCLLCVKEGVVLCKSCYRLGKVHSFHPFAAETKKKEEGGPSPGMSGGPGTGLVPLQSIQYREINPEDYETLLLLDQGVARCDTITPEEFLRLPTRVCVRDEEDSCCAICLEKFTQKRDCVELPCGHILHTTCGRTWLTKHKSECPIDHQTISLR